MGSLEGHVVPGSMFIILSVWWFIGEVLQDRLGNGIAARAKTELGKRQSKLIHPLWYPCPGHGKLSKFPVEPVIKVVFAILGVIAELPASKATALFDEKGEFVPSHVDNYAHTAMYSFFGLTGVVDLVMVYKLLPLPPKFDYLVFSMAFWMEGLLFFFHLHGRDELNVRLHTILYIVILVSGAVFFLAAISDQFFQITGFLKAYLLSLQGSWFFQIGFVLFGPNRWKNVPSNVEFVGIAFALHAIILIVMHLSGHIICYQCFVKQKKSNEIFLEEMYEEALMLEEP